jgi:hypothetical protein
VTRFLRLRVRQGTAIAVAGTRGKGGQCSAGDEIVVRFEDAAPLLRGKARRGVEILEDFEDDTGDTRPDLDLGNPSA